MLKEQMPILHKIKILLLVSMFLMVASQAIAAELSISNEIRQVIQKLDLESMLLSGFESLKFCRTFFEDLEDLKGQSEMVFIKPILETNDIDDPRLEVFWKRCPNMELNRTEKWWTEVDQEKTNPPTVRLRHEIFYGTKHFRLYKVDFTNESEAGQEYGLYFDTLASKDARDKPAWPGGHFVFADFGKCKRLAAVPVNLDQFKKSEGGNPPYTAIVAYRGKHFVLDVAPIKDSYAIFFSAYRGDGRSGNACSLMPQAAIRPE
jgi:hypothetical protein